MTTIDDEHKDSLRRQAEEKIRAEEAHDAGPLSPEEAGRLLHELRVHQVELEMQNEELRGAQHELEDSRDRYFDLYDLAPVGYLTISEKGLILEANLAAAAMLGEPRGELVMRPLSRYIFREDQEIYYLCRKQLFETGKARMIELRMARPDNTRLWVRLDAVMSRREEAGASEWRVMISDISARKQAEEQRVIMEQQLRQTQRLESLGVLAGGIAHDFNNILMVILGNADLALDDLPAMAPARESVRQIVTASQRAAELCRQMLTYAGKGQFVRETINLHDLVEGMVSLLKASISRKALLNLSLEEDLPLMTGDPAQIRQIVMNLLINASEAIDEDEGVITVTTSVIEYSGEFTKETYGEAYAETYVGEELPPGRYLCMEVSDTGRGMDRKTLERLFEPFFTTKFAGRGLGLSAVLGIVRAHEGALKVHSEPGKGTTVRVLFPVMNGAGGESKAVASGALDSWRGSGTVLLVDDEESVRDVCGQMLRRLGFDVITAADGREALELYRQRRNDICLVMLDLTMPHMDGEETCNELRLINPEVRVVLASGYSEIDVASRFADKGIAGAMQKPYTLANLRKLLSGMLPQSGVGERLQKA